MSLRSSGLRWLAISSRIATARPGDRTTVTVHAALAMRGGKLADPYQNFRFLFPVSEKR
jgi:hypothetical protein